MGMGLFMAVGRGSDNPPRMIVMRSGKAGEKDALGRHLAIVGKGVCFDSGGISHQAIRPDGRDEDGQDRRLHGHRGRGHRRAARAGHAAPGPRARRREHARPALDPPGRRREGAQRQVGRHHQHRRRGPADPRRRADLRRAARRDPPRRRGDPHRSGGARPRRAGHRRVRHAAGVRRRRLRRGRAGRRALLAAAAGRGVPGRHGELVRRPRELLAQQRGRPREERAVHPGVRDEAVGPPRHRRHRPTSARSRRTPRAARPACRTRRSSSWRSPARRPDDPRCERGLVRWIAALARPSAVGLVLGLRSPTGSRPAGRSTRTARPAIDWRTTVVVVAGGLAFAATGAQIRRRTCARCSSSGSTSPRSSCCSRPTSTSGSCPTSITLPLIVLAALVDAHGPDPFVRTIDELALGARRPRSIVPLGLFLLAIPFGQGAIGQGDLKLLVSVGLLAGGAEPLLRARRRGARGRDRGRRSWCSTRRLTLKSYVPYGPFLIAGHALGHAWLTPAVTNVRGRRAGHVAVVSRTLAGSRPGKIHAGTALSPADETNDGRDPAPKETPAR